MFGRGRLVAGGVAAVAVALVAGGCHHGSGDGDQALRTDRSSSTSTSTTSSSTSTTSVGATSATTSALRATTTTRAAASTTTTKKAKGPSGTVTSTTRAPATTQGTTSTTQPATTTTVATGPCNSGGGSADANQIANLFCSYRRSHDLPTMTRNSGLDQMAQQWAQKMADDGALSHNPNLSSGVLARCSGCNGWAENVAFDTTAAKAWDGWLASPDHLANISNGQAGEYGVGVVSSGGYLWFVQDFGRYPG